MILRAYTVYTGMVSRASIEKLRGVWDVCSPSIEFKGFIEAYIRITQGLGWAPNNNLQLPGV